MNITISNDLFSAQISPFGAELQSLKNRETNEEYIWQRDPAIWEYSAPVLFPVVGRMKNSAYRFEGKTYPMPLHGFAWTSEFSCTEQGSDQATFLLKDSPETRKVYPFSFELQINFKLSKKGLSVGYTVSNPSEKSLWFTLGSHPAFALRSAAENYRICFNRNETLDLYSIRNDLLEKIQADYLQDESTIPLHAHLFDDDALIFQNITSDSIRLESEAGLSITVETGTAPHLGFWAKPGAPYICIEPWYSVDETAAHNGELVDRPGMIQLAPLKTWQTGYSIAPYTAHNAPKPEVAQ